MTNWDKMRRVVSVSKDYIIEHYGICKGFKGELLPIPCNYISCDKCIFGSLLDCRKQIAEFLEKEVKTNE